MIGPGSPGRGTSHVSDDLSALLDGALPGARRAEVELHLAGCDACRAERELLSRTLAALAELPPPPAPAPGFEQRFYARLARERIAPAGPRGRRGWIGARAGLLRWAVPATGIAAAAAVAFVALEQRQDRLEMARHMDLLEDYVLVASLDVGVESAEDVDVVEHLDEIQGGRP